MEEPSLDRYWITSNARRKHGARAMIVFAYVHLAHAGLRPLGDSPCGAYRLFFADYAMAQAASPRAVLETLGLNVNYIEAVETLYNPEEPRVPAGSGPTSGQWTRLLSWMADSTPLKLPSSAYMRRAFSAR